MLAGYCGFDALLDGDLSPNANARVFIADLPLAKVATLNFLHCGGWGARHRYRSPLLDFYKGALYENFEAEAFIKQGYGLYYYSKENSTLEEDFFIRSSNELIPVEEKSNTNRSKSMAQLIKSDTYPDIRHGIKFTTGNIGISDDIITFPYFCTFLLKRYMEMQKIFK